MTYVELIVVLSIFTLMTSIILFDYGKFQDNVDIKILANDIALKIVEAQKSAIAGKWNLSAGNDWKPSYGVYLSSSLTDLDDGVPFNKKFIYFADLDQSGNYNDQDFCSNSGGIYECLEKIDITKGNYISRIESLTYGSTSGIEITEPLSINFKRPNSSAVFYVNGDKQSFDAIKIIISSPLGVSSNIIVDSSGRFQIN